MDWNWQMIAAMIAVVGVVINVLGFFILKFNDLHHLHLAVTEIQSHLKTQDKTINKFALDLTDLTARFQERTKISKRKTR